MSTRGTIGVQEGAVFTDTTVQVVKNEPKTYINCEFNRVRFNGTMAETKFIGCRFNNATFGVCTDLSFGNCVLIVAHFGGTVTDTTFDRCELAKVRGVWHAVRCRFLQCSLHHLTLRTDARFEQCTFRDTRIATSTLDKASFTDCAVRSSTFATCTLAGAAVRRCTLRNVVLDKCKTTNAAFGGNTWVACTWRHCDDAHSMHVADEETRCRYRNHAAQHCAYMQHKSTGGRYEAVDWAWARFEACRHSDETWMDVSLKNAQVIDTIYHNTHTTNLQHASTTTYRNVQRTRTQLTPVQVHFYAAATVPEVPDVAVTLYGHHRRLSSTTKTHFELKDSDAACIDFVFVVPVLGWFAALGLSAPQSAHHLVSHVTVGDATFFPNKRPYSVAGEGIERIGYYRRRIQRCSSEPKLEEVY